mmetsp:Transcript_7437/g.25374  ORF Transcript_7437/g.25374 Transcript_7437/m.25374 type:complete len:787 (-) Transcript_7437:52-2412(-)
MVRTDSDGVKCEYPSQGTWTFGDIVLSSEFCSGNIGHVEAVDDEQTCFELRTSPDCAGQPFETNYRTWFYFSVSGAKKDQTLTFTVMNMNPQTKMFNQGMKPVYRLGSSAWDKWERIKDEVTYSCGEGRQFQIRFKFRFSSDSTVFFAFSYPYSFEDVKRKLDAIQDAVASKLGAKTSESAIYLERETLTYSLEGRRMEVLTITDYFGASSEREEEIENLFPEGKQRPLVFPEKKYFVLSARVHPGESPAQWMWDGAIDFLVNKEDPRAKALRRAFVFKVVPIINPDGVARGHYRADTQGLNLNRFYDAPDRTRHPTVWAIKELVVWLKGRTNLKFFVDLHAHATKRGCFCYANALPTYQEMIDNMMYARMIAINSAHFDFGSCVFSEKAMESKDRNGQSKEGSSRVGIYRATGLVHSMTVECNYNGGRVVNNKPPAATQDPRASPGETWRGPLPKFNTSIFRDVGKALMVAALDMEELNPWSRVPNSHSKSMAETREWVKSKLLSIDPYRQQILADKKAAQASKASNATEKTVKRQISLGKGGRTLQEVSTRNNVEKNSTPVLPGPVKPARFIRVNCSVKKEAVEEATGENAAGEEVAVEEAEEPRSPSSSEDVTEDQSSSKASEGFSEAQESESSDASEAMQRLVLQDALADKDINVLPRPPELPDIQTISRTSSGSMLHPPANWSLVGRIRHATSTSRIPTRAAARAVDENQRKPRASSLKSFTDLPPSASSKAFRATFAPHNRARQGEGRREQGGKVSRTEEVRGIGETLECRGFKNVLRPS